VAFEPLPDRFMFLLEKLATHEARRDHNRRRGLL
jgi:hypothetical protein